MFGLLASQSCAAVVGPCDGLLLYVGCSIWHALCGRGLLRLKVRARRSGAQLYGVPTLWGGMDRVASPALRCMRTAT